MIPREAVERIEVVRGPMSALRFGRHGRDQHHHQRTEAQERDHFVGGNIYPSDGYIKVTEEQPITQRTLVVTSLLGNLLSSIRAHSPYELRQRGLQSRAQTDNQNNATAVFSLTYDREQEWVDLASMLIRRWLTG